MPTCFSICSQFFVRTRNSALQISHRAGGPLASRFASIIPIMTSLRQCRMTDLLKMSLCNLDPLTENYDTHFYIEYMARWPSLFTVAENKDGQIIGYSELLYRIAQAALFACTDGPFLVGSHGQGRRRFLIIQLFPTLPTVAWSRNSTHSRSPIPAIGHSKTVDGGLRTGL